MKAPKVSIIVPVFNTLPFLDKCFGSLINQTLSPIEIIAVDNGSTDGSLSWLEEFASDKVGVIVLSHPEGKQGDARNAGMVHASGKYIGYVDSDDYVDTTMFEKLYAVAEDTGVEVVTCNAYQFTAQNDQPIRHIFNAHGTWPKKAFRCSDHPQILRNMTPWNRLFKAEFLKRERLTFPGGVFHEDQFFVATALLNAVSIAAVPDCLYYYRRAREGAVNSLSDERHLEFFDVMNMLRERFSNAFETQKNLINELFICKALQVYNLTDGSSKVKFFKKMRGEFRRIGLPARVEILTASELRMFPVVCRSVSWQFGFYLALRRLYGCLLKVCFKK